MREKFRGRLVGIVGFCGHLLDVRSGSVIDNAVITLEEKQAVADEVHKLGRKVAAHAHGTQGIKDAVRAGIDSIENLQRC
jgi:imidazolonepropionase-like amidohydrolase